MIQQFFPCVIRSDVYFPSVQRRFIAIFRDKDESMVVHSDLYFFIYHQKIVWCVHPCLGTITEKIFGYSFAKRVRHKVCSNNSPFGKKALHDRTPEGFSFSCFFTGFKYCYRGLSHFGLSVALSLLTYLRVLIEGQ